MSTLDGGMVSAAFPALVEAFDTDASTVLWVNVAFWVTNVGLLLTMGWLGDVFGRRRVFSVGYLVFTVGLLLAAASLEVWQIIASRIVQGIGSAMTLSNLNALITNSFPSNERGKAMGISGAVVGIGLSVGPLLGGFLLDSLDWRALFYTRAPVGLLGSIMAWTMLTPDRNGEGKFRIDFLGATALFVTLGTLLLALNQGGRHGFESIYVISLTLISLGSLPLLVWTQKRSARPIIDISLFQSRQYTFALLVLVSHYLSHGPILLVAPFFLVNSLEFSASKMGVFLAGFVLGRVFCAPFAGHLSDRFGPRPFLLFGNCLTAMSLFWLSTIGLNTADLALFLALSSAGVGSAFFEPVVTSTIMGSVQKERLGTASASVAMGRHIAFSVGVTLAGAIFAIREPFHLAKTGMETSAIAGAFSDTLLVAVILATAAVVFSIGTSKQAL
jgi:EmrB/QacA subfamily drug resistance transporter